MRRCATLMLTVVMMLSLLAPTSALAQEGAAKVGYVDLEAVLESDSEYQEAMEELQSFKQDLQNRIDSQKEDLSRMKKTLQEESSLLSEQELQKKRQEFQRKMQRFQQRAQRSQVLMQRKKQELLEPIIDRIEPAVRTVAKARDYDVVRTFGQSDDSVLWVSDRVDLTEAVIRQLEATS